MMFQTPPQSFTSLPTTGLLRLPQIIGTLAASPRKKKNIEDSNSLHNSDYKIYPPIVPVSKSTWWAGVKSGRYPQPVRHLGLRITAWRVEDIRRLLESSGECDHV